MNRGDVEKPEGKPQYLKMRLSLIKQKKEKNKTIQEYQEKVTAIAATKYFLCKAIRNLKQHIINLKDWQKLGKEENLF